MPYRFPLAAILAAAVVVSASPWASATPVISSYDDLLLNSFASWGTPPFTVQGDVRTSNQDVHPLNYSDNTSVTGGPADYFASGSLAVTGNTISASFNLSVGPGPIGAGSTSHARVTFTADKPFTYQATSSANYTDAESARFYLVTNFGGNGSSAPHLVRTRENLAAGSGAFATIDSISPNVKVGAYGGTWNGDNKIYDPGTYRFDCDAQLQAAPLNTSTASGNFTVTLTYAPLGPEIPTSTQFATDVTKFYDLNADGVWQSGEPKLGGWNFHISENSGPFNADVVTYPSGTGAGALAMLPSHPATYTITETPQPGWIATTPTVQTLTTTVPAYYGGPLFGNTKQLVPEATTVAFIKYLDLNGNGLIDGADDTPLENWGITLIDPFGSAITLKTDENGVGYAYLTQPGEYYVVTESYEGFQNEYAAFSFNAAGNSNNSSGNFMSFQLPTDQELFESAEAVPEPTTFVLAALGLVALGCVALRKKLAPGAGSHISTAPSERVPA